ncbi:DUF2199 domain-containing protein [Candidatus Saccharibacteria bacterium]|nr:DUF2199 domain-containing protein [Candidatus Saccharibacteria bacterium]
MPKDYKTVCSHCGQLIQGQLPALAFAAPAAWNDNDEHKYGYSLGSDFCTIDNQYFFIRVVLRIPIIDSEDSLEWGVWVSLSEKNFKRYGKVYGTDAELEEEPYFGWLANELPTYPDCSRIETYAHLRGGGLRPMLELNHDNLHPLCQDQHNGVSLGRAHELAQFAGID